MTKKKGQTYRPKRRSQGRSRSASRMAAVQALYQMELSNQDSEAALREFIEHRLGKEIEGEQYPEADEKYFVGLVRGVVERQQEIDRELARAMPKEWPFNRIDPTMRAIMRSATFELISEPTVGARVIVHEYMTIAAAFFAGDEIAFLGGVLSRLARAHRPQETAPPVEQ